MKDDPLLKPSRNQLIDAGALLAMLLIALWTFRSSYGGVGFLIVGVVAAVVGILLAWVAYVRAWPIIVTVGAALVTYLLLGTWLALRHYAFFGVIPTPRSMLEVVTSSVTAWKELITTVPPVGSTGDLMIIPVLLGFFGGLIGFTTALRFKFAAAVLIAPLVITGLGIAVGLDSPVSVVLNGTVLGVVMIGWIAWRERIRRPMLKGGRRNFRRLGMAAALLVIGAFVGSALAPKLPGDDGDRAIWRQTVTPPFDPRVYPSPLAGYRSYVKTGYDENNEPNPAKVMFTVEGLPENIPVRLATMDSYDGLVWQVSGGDANDPSLQDSGSFERIGARLEPDLSGQTATVSITIGKYADVWVPDVGEVISIKFEGSSGGDQRDQDLANSFRYNRATDTGATPIKLREGDRYEMEVRLPNAVESFAGERIEPTVARLGSTRSVAEITQALATPDLLIVNDSGERLDKVRDLMIENGAYSDGDRQAGQYIVSAGHSDSRLSAFAGDFPRLPFIGNAEQFSASYALLFRDLGNIPTRVVMGFLPSESSETKPVEVIQTEAEAWVEVPVAGKGWVAVFPTPPRDQTSTATNTPQQPDPDYRTQNPPPPPLVDPEFDQPAKAEGKAQNQTAEKKQEQDDVALDDDEGILSRPVARYAAIALSPFVVLALASLVVLVIKWIRRRRRQRRGLAHERIANGWREVTDLSTDLGRPIPPTTTRREAAAFVGESSVALAERADDAVWAGRQLSDDDVEHYWKHLSDTLRQMRRETPIWQRFRSYVSIQSLKRRNRSKLR